MSLIRCSAPSETQRAQHALRKLPTEHDIILRVIASRRLQSYLQSVEKSRREIYFLSSVREELRCPTPEPPIGIGLPALNLAPLSDCQRSGSHISPNWHMCPAYRKPVSITQTTSAVLDSGPRNSAGSSVMLKLVVVGTDSWGRS